MIDPDDRAKSCSLSLGEIQRRLKPEQLKALRTIWQGIAKARVPAMAYLHVNETFEQMLIDAARELFEVMPHEKACQRVAQRYGAIAWLECKARTEGLERRSK